MLKPGLAGKTSACQASLHCMHCRSPLLARLGQCWQVCDVPMIVAILVPMMMQGLGRHWWPELWLAHAATAAALLSHSMRARVPTAWASLLGKLKGLFGCCLMRYASYRLRDVCHAVSAYVLVRCGSHCLWVSHKFHTQAHLIHGEAEGVSAGS